MFRFALIDPRAKAPQRKNPTDAGVDIFSLTSTIVMPHHFSIIRTGVTFEIPEGYCLQAWPKSRNNHLVGAGILDAGYQGEVLIKVVNPFDGELAILAGDPIAQLVLVAIKTDPLEQVELGELHKSSSERGGTGGIVTQLNR